MKARQTFNKDFCTGENDYIRLEIRYCPRTRKTAVEIEGNNRSTYKDCAEGVELTVQTVNKATKVDLFTHRCYYIYCLERLSRYDVRKLRKWFSYVEKLSEADVKQLADKGYCRNEADKVFEKINEVASNR